MRKVLTVAATAVTMLALLALTAPAASANDDDHGPCHNEPLNVVVGSIRNDRLIGSFCDDLVFGFAGNDVIRGRTGEDTLRGGSGNDRISALGFTGRIVGGPGIDTCSVLEFSQIAVVSCEIVIEV